MPLDRADRLRITNVDTGDTIDEWESAEISSDFLRPCDTFRFQAGSDDAPIEIAKRFPEGANVVISAVLEEGREAFLIDGYVDVSETYSGRDGRRCVVEGRDFLSQVVDSNVDPRMVLPTQPTIEQVIDAVLEQFGIERNRVEENVRTHEAIGRRLKKRPPLRPSRRSKKQSVNDSVPRDNEGAFTFLARLLSDHGYWLWAARSPENRYVVVAGPNYDQDAYYTLRMLRGASGAANNVEHSTMRVDGTGMPSHVFVKGTFFGPGDRKKNVAVAENAVASRFKPAYLVDQKAKTKDSTERIARSFLGKAARNYVTYSATVSGMADPETGAVYCVDTICDVRDDDKGVYGPMWVESCAIHKSRQGTTTDLKLIPRGTLVLDWQPDEDVDLALDYAAALARANGSKSFHKTRSFKYNGVEFWGGPP